MHLWIHWHILTRNKQWDDHSRQRSDAEFDPKYVAFLQIFRFLRECSKGPDISVDVNSKHAQQDKYIISRCWSTPFFHGNRNDGHCRAVKLELIMTSGIVAKRSKGMGFTNVRVKKPSEHPTKRCLKTESTPGWFFWHFSSKEFTESAKRTRHPNKRATMNK